MENSLLKICFITSIYPPTYRGGPGEVVYNLQKFFLEEGEQAYVFTCGVHEKRYSNTIRIPGGQRSFLLTSPLYFFRENKKTKFDILNFSLESGMGLAPFLFFHDKPKVTTTLHTEYLNERHATKLIKYDGEVVAQPTFQERLSKLLTPAKFAGTYLDMSVSDRIFAVSEKTKKDYVEQNQISAEKISVIYNGVDSNKFHPEVSRELIREKYSLGDSLIILTVGSGIVLKGCIFVLFAIKEILKVYPNLKLMMVGIDPNHKERMINIAKKLGVQNSIIVINRIPNNQLPYYFSASDIVVVPSLFENFPVVILEAMSSGKPVVASRVGGIPEAIKENETGLLFDPGNVSQMTEKIFYLLSDLELRRKLGEAGRRLVEKRFDWKIIGRTYQREFEKLLSE
jgi:glycosyltransferase involved in cell wall biosynthesis